MVRISFFATVALVVSFQPASARRCYEPSVPACASGYGAFDDEDDFRSCKSDMENYQSEVEEYLSCLKKSSNETLDDYNAAVDSFNRRAQDN
ncbi:MAG: hypothetical protein IKE42_02510 [Aquamicrobium sp.]|jgi:hypothetical protein|uniref:hypothetical protein n=1 Tax=Mesorhizobium sp. Pch-S TaxID=2082387 RepID=UPI001011ED8B|nr:hypothetical protein [Mesorhizobium sp. Pch-S]MBR2686699.1 hypothetical protein [Aquamicrobium sp.]